MYTIKQDTPLKAHFTFYGGAREFVRYKGPEAVIEGPSETGKTISTLFKIHLCACKYPGSSIVIMRKTLASTTSSVIQTFVEKVLGEHAPVEAFGGQRPSHFQYKNGSRIWVGGMDKSSKLLSSEHDIIYFNQVEEAELDEWEVLTTRTTGRAGHMPYGQTIGDMNSSYPGHWPYTRASLKMFHSRHEENPLLFDQVTGEITEQGTRTLNVLNNLTGARRERLLYGRPAKAEGVIYDEWDDSVHLVYSDSIPVCYRYVAGVDWGYRNPGCIGVFGIDGRDGGAWLVKQYYHTLKTDDWWLERALELHEEFSRNVPGTDDKEHLIEAWVCDPSEPAYIEKFNRAGLNAIPGFNSVMPGITAFKARLSNNLFHINRDSLALIDPVLKCTKQPCCIQDEFAGYVWGDSARKDTPVKERDHGMDMCRYVVAYLSGLGQQAKKKVATW